MTEEKELLVEEQPKKKRGRPRKVVEATDVKEEAKEEIKEEFTTELKANNDLQRAFDILTLQKFFINKQMHRQFVHWATSYQGSKTLAKRRRKIAKMLA